MSTESNARTFFTSPYFAVVGASSDPAKFGHKIFAWYINHSLPATPINPSSATISVGSTEYPALASISLLPHPTETGISIITPPKITLKVLEEAKGLGVKNVWLQPGTFNPEVLAKVKEYFPDGGVAGEVFTDEGVGKGIGADGEGGWCVLVDGERVAKGAGREIKL